jgi:hypothetical protein
LAHVHEPTPRRRLRELVDEVPAFTAAVLGTSAGPAIDRIVNARNAITHWSPSTPHPRGLELTALRLACDALFDLKMFRDMGMRDEELTRLGEQIGSESKVRYWLDRAAERAVRSPSAD